MEQRGGVRRGKGVPGGGGPGMAVMNGRNLTQGQQNQMQFNMNKDQQAMQKKAEKVTTYHFHHNIFLVL